MVERLSPISAGSYLQDAAEALDACGSAPAIYGLWGTGSSDPAVLTLTRARTGPDRQRRFARTCVLFSALAAEAYINGFLQTLEPTAFQSLEKMSPPEKYLVGTAFVVRNGQLFHPGKQPLQTLVELFRLRNELVHPKPHKALRKTITSAIAAKVFIAVAHAACILAEALERPDLLAYAIVNDRARYEAWGARWDGRLPDEHEVATESLLMASVSRVVDARSPKGRAIPR